MGLREVRRTKDDVGCWRAFDRKAWLGRRKERRFIGEPTANISQRLSDKLSGEFTGRAMIA
jgi:hypothetical protein